MIDIFDRNKDIEDEKMLSPLVWAYVGDGVYELFIRTYLVNTSNAKPHKLHIESIKYVRAGAQSAILEKIKDKLTGEELDIVRRGRNTDNHHLPKNSNIAEYSYSTGFEALLGYLYLSKQDERLEEILKMCLH